MKLVIRLIIVLCFASSIARSQTINDYYLYSYDHALFNPAAAGAEDKHVIGLNGSLRTDDKLDMENAFYRGLVSYNGNIPVLKSGIGVLALANRDSHHSLSKVAASYNYKITLAPKTSIRIGLRPHLSRLSFDYTMYTYLDFVLIKRGIKESENVADLDLGVWFSSFGFYIGISTNNVLNQGYDFLEARTQGYYSMRTTNVILGRQFKFPVIQLDPSIGFFRENKRSYLNLSNNFTIKNLFVIGGSYIKLMDEDNYNFTANAGFNIKNRVQLIGVVYTRNNHRPNYDNYKYFEGLVRVKI